MNTSSGKLIVFEGPDGVGKTTLAHELVSHLRSNGIECEYIHMFAHMDVLENQIIPKLKTGISIVLDRFWWTTWVQSITSGTSKQELKLTLKVEQDKWNCTKPDVIFFIKANRPHKPEEHNAQWYKTNASYKELVDNQELSYPIRVIGNDGDITSTINAITEISLQVCKQMM